MEVDRQARGKAMEPARYEAIPLIEIDHSMKNIEGRLKKVEKG